MAESGSLGPGSSGPDPLLVVPRLRRGAGVRAQTWWARAFVRAGEERARDPRDAERGRALARSGRLGALVVLPGLASAAVDPSGEVSWLPQVACRRLPEADWRVLADVVGGQSRFLVALEAGELPDALIERLDEDGVALLPESDDLETACDCGVWGAQAVLQPCVHALALVAQLGVAMARDPGVLLALRGGGLDRVRAPDRAGEVADAAERARRILALAEDPPSGHGLADPVLASYDEEVAGLVDPTGGDDRLPPAATAR